MDTIRDRAKKIVDMHIAEMENVLKETQDEEKIKDAITKSVMGVAYAIAAMAWRTFDIPPERFGKLMGEYITQSIEHIEKGAQKAGYTDEKNTELQPNDNDIKRFGKDIH